jgi:hypothetical protein
MPATATRSPATCSISQGARRGSRGSTGRIHDALAALLDAAPPALILSLHSFTPSLRSAPEEARPWQVGVLYNADDRAARLAIPLLAAEGLVVGDQQPYSGKLLNATMNRHAEAEGAAVPRHRGPPGPDSRCGGAGRWAERLARIANAWRCDCSAPRPR